jgi:hypothetical protein
LLNVRTSGQPIEEVLRAVSGLAPRLLRAAAEVAGERVVVDFRAGTLAEFQAGVAELLGCGWIPQTSEGGKPSFRLELKAATRGLEERLARLPFKRGVETLSKRVTAELDKWQATPNAEFQGIGDTYGRLFVTLLTPSEVDALLKEQYIAAPIDKLTPAQQDALYHYARGRLSQNSFDPKDRALLEALTPEKLGTMTLVVRTSPSDGVGLLDLNIPEVGSLPVVLDTEATLFAQGASPYQALGNGAAIGAGGQPGAAAGAAQGKPVEAKLPTDWNDAVATLRSLTGRNVFADCYTFSAFRANVNANAAGDYHARNWTELLGEFCTRSKRVWWQQGASILVRDQSWYVSKHDEPPARVARDWEQAIRAGRLGTAVLNAVARLPRPQVRALLHRTWRSESDVSEHRLADGLVIFAAGGLAQKQAMLTSGLPVGQFTPGQVKALRQLAPDSVIRQAAERSGDGFALRIEQDRRPAGIAIPARTTALLFRFHDSGPSPLEMLLVVPEKEPERILSVELVGGVP